MAATAGGISSEMTILFLLQEAGGLTPQQASAAKQRVIATAGAAAAGLRRGRPAPLRPIAAAGHTAVAGGNAAAGDAAAAPHRHDDGAVAEGDVPAAEGSAGVRWRSLPAAAEGDEFPPPSHTLKGAAPPLRGKGTETWRAPQHTLPPQLADLYAVDTCWRTKQGGFGKVSKARDTRDGSAVAVKEVFPKSFEKLHRAIKVLREARVHAHLTGAGPGCVVRMRDIAVSGERQQDGVWFVMDFVDSDLYSLLPPRTHGIGSLEQACFIMRRLLVSLRLAHACGIVHRDLKPHNVLVSKKLEGSVVMLADFGFARSMPEEEDPMMTQFGTSHAYWAPEVMMQDAGYAEKAGRQGRGAAVQFAHGVRAAYDAKADMWAAGAIFAELLGWGSEPFAVRGSDVQVQRARKLYAHGTLAGQLQHIDQLYKVQQVIGAPSSGDLDDCQASADVREWYARTAGAAGAAAEGGGAVRAHLRAHAASAEGSAAVDLLLGLLTYSPRRRLSAADALQHPLFARHFAGWEEPGDGGVPTRFRDDSEQCRSVDEVMAHLRSLARGYSLAPAPAA